MYLDYIKQINDNEIKENRRSIINKPVSEDEIQTLINDSRTALQYTPCDEYLNLLRLTDGYDAWHDDGRDFYSLDDFVGLNLDWREIDGNRYILFGSGSSAPVYLYDLQDKKYLIADRFYTPDENDLRFDSFSNMASYVLKQQVYEFLFLDLIKSINDRSLKTSKNSLFSEPKIDYFNETLEYLNCGFTDIDHQNFLELTNGFEWDDKKLYSAERVISETKRYYNISDKYRKFIILGRTENKIYTYNIKNLTCNIASLDNLDKNFQTFISFGELILDGVFESIKNQFIDNPD